MNNKNCYLILHLGSTATKKEIKTSYRKLATLYHPDKPGGDAEKFKVIKQAYDALMKDRGTSVSAPSRTTRSSSASSSFPEPQMTFASSHLHNGAYRVNFMVSGVKRIQFEDNVWELPHNTAYSRKPVPVVINVDAELAKYAKYKIKFSLEGVNGKIYNLIHPINFERHKSKSKFENLFGGIW